MPAVLPLGRKHGVCPVKGSGTDLDFPHRPQCALRCLPLPSRLPRTIHRILHGKRTSGTVGKGQVTSFARFDVQGTWAENQAKNADFYDGNVDFHLGWHYNWQVSPRWRLRAGGLAGLSAGGTYSTRNGNNPAQGRAAFDVRASLMADCGFHLFGKGCSARFTAEAPLAGLMFSPQYGQSYYEIFSLRHYDGNVRFTYPGNVPSVRLGARLRFPVRKAMVVAGYEADIRQSRVNRLDRHAWNHSFIIGFTRQLSF